MSSEQQMPLAGKIALVTGSGQGIGRATAQRLARDGADIVINYRSNANAAAEAKASIEALGTHRQRLLHSRSTRFGRASQLFRIQISHYCLDAQYCTRDGQP